MLQVADCPLLVGWLTQLILTAGHGTWHCHCHSTGLSRVLGQKPCCKPWSLEYDCHLAGHPQHSVLSPGSPSSRQARQKHILSESSGHQQGLVKAAFSFLGAPFVRKGRQPCLQLTRPRPNTAVPVRATRTGSLQPMLAGMMPSQPNSSFSSWSQDSTRP